MEALKKKPPPEAGTGAPTPTLPQVLQEANLTLDQIRSELEFVAWIAERFKEVSVKTSLSGCGGALENVTTAFRLVPEATTVSFTFGKAGEYRSVVVGGKPPYFANLLRKPEAGTLTADLLSEPAGYQLRISADTKVKAGDYPVAVRDSSAAEPKLITVRVEEEKATTQINSPQPTPAGTKTPGSTK